MKLIHLSDLHLGKRVNEWPMLEDQAYILDQILTVLDREQPQGVLIAGDIYDRPVPPAEAVCLFDRFLVQLTQRDVPVLVISGNHDSPERIAFGQQLIRKSGVYLSPVYNGSVEPVTLTDEFGPLDVFLLPFLKPVHLRRFFPEEELSTYTDAIACALAHMPVDKQRRNVLVTHQFVAGAMRCDSEELSVGGSDSVSAAVFEDFDYVALGHLHGPQNVCGERIRYCGSPLKYSFSETKHCKSVTVVELREKGNLAVRTVPLEPLRDLVELRGTYLELTARRFYQELDRSSYFHVTLTDEQDVPDAIGKLRVIYPNLLQLDYDNRRTRSSAEILGTCDMERKSPLELFAEFYEQQNNQPLSPEQRGYLQGLIEKVWEGQP